MYTWLTAAVYCEETFGVQVDMAEGFFVCPECGELIYECDWDAYSDWDCCPICEWNFMEGE
jgi:predicted RNA-binding Zn-ribbon protein involved in translation (DUF1610 family)